MKQPSQGMPRMMGAEAESFRMQGWQEPTSWQGELGPNLMPLTTGQKMQHTAGPPSMQHILSSGYAGPDLSGRSMQNMPNMMGPGLPPSTYVGRNVSGMPMDVQPPLQMQPPHNMSNMQVIVLPAGAPPPPGAIPVGGMHATGQQQLPHPQMVQMVEDSNHLVWSPVGEAPPEGAIPVDQFSLPSTAPSTPPESEAGSPSRQATKAFKIKDPRTGLQVCAPSEEKNGARRRLRIVNPKTGEEVRPDL
jgi:hypothetical protein